MDLEAFLCVYVFRGVWLGGEMEHVALAGVFLVVPICLSSNGLSKWTSIHRSVLLKEIQSKILIVDYWFWT